MAELNLYKFLCTLIIILVLSGILILIFMALIELLISKKETDKFIEEKNKEDLIEKFYNTLDKAKTQITKEILECLIEMEKLDKIYEEIKETDIDFISEISYLKLKETTLNNIIEEKISKIESQKRKKESFKALLDEITICRKRYPQYNSIYVDKENYINNKIEK